MNSVPQFESRFLQRSKHPYTAKSSAITIRHAVAIDERRAKFRQDLLGEREQCHSASHDTNPEKANLNVPKQRGPTRDEDEGMNTRYRRAKKSGSPRRASTSRRPSRMDDVSPNRSLGLADYREDQRSVTNSTYSMVPRERQTYGEFDDDSDDETDEALPQDIQEVWFPGCHADIGAGWPLENGEEIALSHGPLVWMVREASKAGLRFDRQKVDEMKCGGNMGYEEEEEEPLNTELRGNMIPQVHVTSTGSPSASRMQSGIPETAHARRDRLHRHLHTAATLGRIHDSLKFKNGTPSTGVVAWNIMEHLPFRRMDLQGNGSWKSIRWPLPMGEVRDIPESAIIHTSALRRMEADESYRPGNLIVGGGGRGTRVAPKEYGVGKWEIVREKGDPVGECMVRKKPPAKQERGQQNGTSEATDFQKI